MIRSMTSFARQTSQQDWGSFVWEIRSVNHRYLEPSFKLSDNVRHLENDLRKLLRKNLSRGKVECSVRVQLGVADTSNNLSIDDELLSQIIGAVKKVQNQLDEPTTLNPLDILKWPGVILEAETNTESMSPEILNLFETTLKQLIEGREREGSALRNFIEQRLTTIAQITLDVRAQLPAILQTQRVKLSDRLEQLKTELDPERLEQEMVLLAQKADVDEELDRLDTHINEVRRVLKKGGACGRRLDFLMQELNREANTLSSKSIVSETTQAAVELKVLIEQMREQIQNIE
jgi:uncharacterized protein (TIGR00255 family)